MPKLELLRGSNIRTTYLLKKDQVWVGSDQRCSVCIQEPGISRFHLKLLKDEDQKYWLKDIGGSFGTLINGRDTENERLFEGDILTLGRTKIRYIEQDSSEQELSEQELSKQELNNFEHIPEQTIDMEELMSFLISSQVHSPSLYQSFKGQLKEQLRTPDPVQTPESINIDEQEPLPPLVREDVLKSLGIDFHHIPMSSTGFPEIKSAEPAKNKALPNQGTLEDLEAIQKNDSPWQHSLQKEQRQLKKFLEERSIQLELSRAQLQLNELPEMKHQYEQTLHCYEDENARLFQQLQIYEKILNEQKVLREALARTLKENKALKEETKHLRKQLHQNRKLLRQGGLGYQIKDPQNSEALKVKTKTNI